MGFLAPALPWILKGGAMLGGSLIGKKLQGSAQKRSPEEATALAGAQGAAGNLTTQGTSLINQGTPMVGQAGNYWSTLLRGNRAQMAEATAGPRAALTDIYRGGESNLERSGVRGAQRDVATAELGRDRTNAIAQLTTGVQPAAATQLSETGSRLISTGAPMVGQAGSIWSNLLNQGQYNRMYAREEGSKAGGPIGGLIFDILNGTIGKKFGGGGGISPSTLFSGGMLGL